MDEYNYAVFDLQREEPSFVAFRDALHVGDRPPRAVVEDLDSGEAVALESLWRKGLAILEFGSFT